MRKELRRNGGIVRMSAGSPEERQAIIDRPWSVPGETSDAEDVSLASEEDEGDSANENSEEEDEDEDDGGDEDEDDDEDEVPSIPILSGKQKRKATTTLVSAPPSKKVTFAGDAKGSKKESTASRKKVTSSALKSKAQVPTQKPRAANVGVKPKGIKTAAVSEGGVQAYDFNKFF
jgi:nuclear GTP-binding protein